MTARTTKSAPGEAGYGKPPRHTQFRKGRSGNPRGRPSRDPAQGLKALMLQEAYRWTTVKENGRMVPATAMQAVLRSHIELAANGNVQAQRAILAAVQKIEDHNEYQEWLAELRRARYERPSGTGTCTQQPDAAEGFDDETRSAGPDL
jgi:Family of unknown function (DUF5681)